MNLLKRIKVLFNKKKAKINPRDPLYADLTTGKLTIAASQQIDMLTGTTTTSGTINSTPSSKIFNIPSTGILTFPSSGDSVKDFMKELYKKFGEEKVEQFTLKDIIFFIALDIIPIIPSPIFGVDPFTVSIKNIMKKRNKEKVSNMKLKEFFTLITAREKDEKEREIYKTILKKLL